MRPRYDSGAAAPNTLAAWLAFTVIVLIVIGGCTALWQGPRERRPCRESVSKPSPC